MTEAIAGIRSARPVILLSVVVAMMSFESACTSTGSAAASGTSSCLPDSPASTRYSVSGVVMDESGGLVANAEVVVDYIGAHPSSRFIGTRTDDEGKYQVTFCTDAREFKGTKGAIGVVSAYSRGHHPGVRMLSGGTGKIVQNLRLDSVR